MTKRMLIIAAFTLLLGSRAWAEGRKARVYGGLDIFVPANAGDGLWDDIQLGLSQLSGMGYSSVGSIETKAAVGGRLGLKVPIVEEFDIGGSVGYLLGPNSEASITVAGGGRTAILTDSRDVSFLRFLVEPTLNVKMSDAAAFHLGAGLGVASGRTSEEFRCTGSACVVPGSTTKATASWTGFTWEISPYFSIRNFLIGGRYAGFPKFKGDNDNSKIEWTSGGVFIGFEF